MLLKEPAVLSFLLRQLERTGARMMSQGHKASAMQFGRWLGQKS